MRTPSKSASMRSTRAATKVRTGAGAAARVSASVLLVGIEHRISPRLSLRVGAAGRGAQQVLGPETGCGGSRRRGEKPNLEIAVQRHGPSPLHFRAQDAVLFVEHELAEQVTVDVGCVANRNLRQRGRGTATRRRRRAGPAPPIVGAVLAVASAWYSASACSVAWCRSRNAAKRAASGRRRAPRAGIAGARSLSVPLGRRRRVRTARADRHRPAGPRPAAPKSRRTAAPIRRPPASVAERDRQRTLC